MNKYLSVFLLLLVILYSCNTKQESKTTDKAIALDTLVPLKFTVISDLPDSMQPKTILLDSMPKPMQMIVPSANGNIAVHNFTNLKKNTGNLVPPVKNMLPVLLNEKGEPILDGQGKPFVMGDGGKSNFTNFTSDDGLISDAINCTFMDKKGTLWFGANTGVSRYDGTTFITLTNDFNISSNQIGCIQEDKDGNLWFGTWFGGVIRYDGTSFINFNRPQGLKNGTIRSIEVDIEGNMWFGTQGGGVSRYDYKLAHLPCNTNTCLHDISNAKDLEKHNFEISNAFTNFSVAEGMLDSIVLTITLDQAGNLWFGTNRGVTSYNTILAKNPCNNHTCKHNLDKAQDFENHRKEIAKSFKSYTINDGLADNCVHTIKEDKNGSLWFGTRNGVSRLNGTSFTNFTTSEGLANNNVLSIEEDKSGNLWFGTEGGGVSRFDGNTFNSFNASQGIAYDVVNGITVDKIGNIWFATGGGGVSRYDGNSFNSFTKAYGLTDNNIRSLLEDKNGNLWIGTLRGGVSCYNGNSFTNYSTTQGLVNNCVMAITEDKSGKLWFGTRNGVSCFDGKSFTNYSTMQGLANNTVSGILEDKNGNLWFATNGGGVSCFNGKSFRNFNTSQGLGSNSVYCITEDKYGNLWFGNINGGVSRYDGNSFTNFGAAQGLGSMYISVIKEDKSGNLWFGTTEGLSIVREKDLRAFNNKKNEAQKGDFYAPNFFKTFKMKDGLPNDFILQIIQLPNGKMAIGTPAGITTFSVHDDFSELENIEIFQPSTGYPVRQINGGQNSMFLDSKGKIWAGTGNEKTALVKFDYSALKKSLDTTKLFLKSLNINDASICWQTIQTKGIKHNAMDSSLAFLQEILVYGNLQTKTQIDSILKRVGNIRFDGISRFYPIPINLVLPYEHNLVSFEFVAIETDKPFLVHYQFKMEGYDKDWSPITRKNSARFGNLNEGTYTFKVKACGSNGVWCRPIEYTFIVLPPWYRTWWAYLIYAFLFLAALRIFSHWREKNLRAEKEKLERTVEERTAELVHKNQVVEEQKAIVEKEKKRSDDLLLNILPEEVAEELKAKGSSEAKQFDEVTVLFTDFKNFTQLSEKMTAKELVKEINTCFIAFDYIMERYGIEKIKTIGDSYMCVGGLPVANATHAWDVVSAGLDIQTFIQNKIAERIALGLEPFQIRIGIHTGPVVAGIVGIKKFAYDIWGDTVNTASRMESSGEAGKVNISGETYELVKDKFTFTHRGKIQAKGKGELDMYFVEGRI